MTSSTPYYRRDLAVVHHLGFGCHADMCAPGILELLEPVRVRRGVVVELGCGSGLLTRHLVHAGHRVIASVGHVLSYLPDEASIERALVRVAGALKTDGVLAVDICDLEWGERRRDAPASGRVGEEWAIVTESSVPTPDRFVRQIAVFVRNDDGSWRRDDERHENVLIDTTQVPAVLAAHGVEARVAVSFGGEQLPVGLRAIVGRRPPAA